MSDRIADEVEFVIYDHLMELDLETSEQQSKMADAIDSLSWIADDDRERHGETPTDALVRAVESRENDG